MFYTILLTVMTATLKDAGIDNIDSYEKQADTVLPATLNTCQWKCPYHTDQYLCMGNANCAHTRWGSWAVLHHIIFQFLPSSKKIALHFFFPGKTHLWKVKILFFSLPSPQCFVCVLQKDSLFQLVLIRGTLSGWKSCTLFSVKRTLNDIIATGTAIRQKYKL